MHGKQWYALSYRPNVVTNSSWPIHQLYRATAFAI